MSREPKKQYCAYCGAALGVYVSHEPEQESCGSQECEREIRYMNDAAEAERREAAENDRYSRY